MLQHLRYAVRSHLRKPLVAIAAAVTLGLGIGGATAVFSVVRTVVLRPLPFPEPDRLVRIWELTRDGDRFSYSAPNYLDLRAESRALMHVAAFNDSGVSAVVAEGGEPQRLTVVRVSASLPGVLGVRPAFGRMFSEDEDRPGLVERRVVLSDGLWRQRFGAAAGILERTITLDGKPFIVTGVMPPRFDFPGGADVWIPLAADPRSDRGNKELAVVGRLAAGSTLGHLHGELREIARRASAAYPESNAGWSAEAVTFGEWIVAPRVRDAMWVLLGAVGLLLLLACANVANLLIAQAVSREGEMRVRGALGASRTKLVQQLLTESALLAGLGTGAGVLIAVWCVEGVRALGSGQVPRLDELRVDGAVLAFACATGAASCFIFGLAPALHAARVDLRSAIDAGSRYTAGNRRLRHMLVVAEVALAVLLLVAAGLTANSFLRLMRVDPGFDTKSTLAMPIELPSSRYDENRVAPFYGELLDRVRAVPGVIAAGATTTNPFRQSGFSNSVTPVERAAAAPPSGLVQAGWRSVTPGFFEALGVAVLSGRTFTDADRADGERVIVISESLARRLWPGDSAVGKQIYWGGTSGRPRTIVGVTRDIRDVELGAAPTPILFVPHAQVDVPSMTIVVRTRPGVTGVPPALRAAVRALDAALPAPAIHEIGVSRSELAAGPRFNVSLLTAFAAIALLLAGTGVYAMLAFTVSERRREIAVRLALGASGPRIARAVLRSGVGLAVVGVAAGSTVALAATRLLTRLLYDVEPTDPLTFAAAAATLIVVAGLACYLPARQASRVDPVVILRE
jgi:putative ABC transport system permease protein